MPCFSAGYYVARMAKRSAYMAPEMIPEEVLSASGCICECFPDDWAIEWASVSQEERVRAAGALGVSPANIGNVISWGTESFGKHFGWPSAFYTLEAAVQARATFLPDDPSIVTFGLSLEEADVQEFLAAAGPKNHMGPSGIFECVNAGATTRYGGEFLGFELLSTDSGLLTCSWLCNGLEKECAQQLGVRTNRSGFIQSYSDALRCAEFISRPETGAEPGLWLPWRVTMYSALSQFQI